MQGLLLAPFNEQHQTAIALHGCMLYRLAVMVPAAADAALPAMYLLTRPFGWQNHR